MNKFLLFLLLTVSAASAQTASQNIQWDDNSTNETGFTVEVAPAAPSTAFAPVGSVSANVTTYTITGLALKTGYQVRIRAFNADTQSGYSNTVAFITPPAPINAPTLRLGAATVVAIDVPPGGKMIFSNGPLRTSGAGKISFRADEVRQLVPSIAYYVQKTP